MIILVLTNTSKTRLNSTHIVVFFYNYNYNYNITNRKLHVHALIENIRLPERFLIFYPRKVFDIFRIKYIII
jgi:hypothetical protein